MMLNDNVKKTAVKAIASGLVAYGLATLNNEEGSLSVLGYDIPTAMAIGGATVVGSAVVEPVKNAVLPLIENNEHLRRLEGMGLDILVSGALPVAFLYVNGNRPADLMGLATTFAYGSAGTIAGGYIEEKMF